MMWLPAWCTFVYCHRRHSVTRDARPKRREGSSCDGQDFVADQMEANSPRPCPVEEERRGRFNHVLTQLVPRIRLREDVLGEAFGAIAAVGFLDHFEHQLRHTSMIRHDNGINTA